ncbi:MAG: acyl-CoA dehydrogenase family protein [Actinobacteria bacterium]|nr:acyl-CoA dehydrogenase family protein [Actinomycetota bacterium]
MNDLSPQQRELQGEARRFATERVLPLANELDRRQEEIPWELLDEIADRGWFGITIPEEHGGLGLGMLEYCLVVEELARAWMSVASVVGRGNAHLDDVLHSDAERAEYLPRIAAGRFIGAFALSEEEAGSDVSNLRCAATELPDGGWRIDGTKKWCGHARRADYILLYARTDDPPEDSPHLGISAFLITKERDAFPEGLTGEPVDRIGYYGLTTWALEFDGLELPGDALMGERGEAFYGIMQGLDRKRVYTAARAIGLARGGLEDAVAYVQDRRQFDQRLADFQALRFRLADMSTEIEAARSLTHRVARAVDRGDEGPEVSQAASQAKLFASEMAERVTSEALQMHGGNGYLYDFPVQRYWRDARLTRIFEGTSEIQRRIISDRLLDD